MDIQDSVALVTGANRGLGRELAHQLLERGAAKVYATARRPETIDLPGVEALRLDLTDRESIAAVASAAPDVDLLINNAGISTGEGLVTGDLDQVRAEMDTHFWGTLEVTRAFAPSLARQGGGAIVNLLSALSFYVVPGNGAYAAAKAAEWQLTNSTRLELAGQGTQVLAAHLAATDTDMMSGYDGPKNPAPDAVRMILDALEAGRSEVLDADTERVKARLSEPAETVYAGFLG